MMDLGQSGAGGRICQLLLRDMSSNKVQKYLVNWLDLEEVQSKQPVAIPTNEDVYLLKAPHFPAWYFFSMYDAVGQQYEWKDMHLQSKDKTERFLNDKKVCMYTMIREGWSQGFFILDTRVEGVCDISYFGLVAEAIGKGLGGWLLDQALMLGWENKDVKRITVNTCSLDHQHALSMYKSRGFRLIKSEIRERIIEQDS